MTSAAPPALSARITASTESRRGAVAWAAAGCRESAARRRYETKRMPAQAKAAGAIRARVGSGARWTRTEVPATSTITAAPRETRRHDSNVSSCCTSGFGGSGCRPWGLRPSGLEPSGHPVRDGWTSHHGRGWSCGPEEVGADRGEQGKCTNGDDDGQDRGEPGDGQRLAEPHGTLAPRPMINGSDRHHGAEQHERTSDRLPQVGHAQIRHERRDREATADEGQRGPDPGEE